MVEMSKIMEDLIDNEKRECALRMLADRELPLEKIAEYSGLNLEQVKELLQLKENAIKTFMNKIAFAEKSIEENGIFLEEEVEAELSGI